MKPWRPWLHAVLLLLAVSCAGRAQTWLSDEAPVQYNISGVAHVPDAVSRARLWLNFAGANDGCRVSFDGKVLAVVSFVSGKMTYLLSPQKLPGNEPWHFLIKVRGDRVTIVVNGELVGQGRMGLKAGGRIGWETDGKARFDELRMQEVEPVFFSDDFMRGEEDLGDWEVVSGQWKTRSVDSVNPDPKRSANPFSYEAIAEGKALSVTGRGFWDNYLCRVSVKPEAPGAVGLVVFYQDSRNYILFRWWSNRSQQEGRARQLVYVRDGKEQIVRASGSGYEVGQWYRLLVKATDSRLDCSIDGKPVLEVFSPPLGGGRIGLYAEKCALVSFDDVLCRHWESAEDDLSPRLDAPRVMPQFEQEDTMQEWANPDYDWRRGEDNWWWHRGRFWGDASISVDLPDPEGAAATAEFCFHAEPGQPDSGYRLFTESASDGSRLSYRLTRRGQLLGEGNVKVDSWPLPLEVRRNGSLLLLDVGNERVLTARDPQPLTGTGIALRTTGKRIPTQQIYPTSTNCLDDTFAAAPVNWWQGNGRWEVTNRWQCDPRWSWMTGWQSCAPVLWSKIAIAGDFILEAYVSNKMEQQGGIAYTHPGDLNVTVCADGKDLGSGYSFIFAGWRNTGSGLFRRGQECVPRNTKAVLRNPSNLNFDFHRNWFLVRVERQGNRLRHWVEDELVSEFTDPDPIPSGHIALWTLGNDQLNNGIVVARVRLWFERAVEAAPFPARRFVAKEDDPWKFAMKPLPEQTMSLRHDFESDTQGWSGFNRREGALVSLDSSTAASGRKCLLIENPTSGGDFTLWSGVPPFEAMKMGTLRFAYNIPPEVKVNLYLRIGQGWYAIEFTGGPQPPGTCPMLGKIEGVVADNHWHTAEFDLRAALRRLLPAVSSVLVERLCFSAPSDTYYRAGIGGNGLGCKWRLDAFELKQ